MTKVLQLCLPSVSYSIIKERRQWFTLRATNTRKNEVAKAHYQIVRMSGRPLSRLVEIAGLEPAASGLQSRRSPS